MTLYELVENYNNIVSLENTISKDLFNSALKLVQQEIIDKIENIIEYRKSLVEEEKTSKLIELDEYIQYCLILANIDKVVTEQYELEVIKPIESIQHQEKSIRIKEKLT